MTLNAKRNYFTVVISSYVIFEKDGKVLLARRLNTGYRDGEYSLPAGHIEEAEFATAAAVREAQEEVGVEVKLEDLEPAHIMHRHCGDHERIDFFFTTQKWMGDMVNAEPEKCDDLKWTVPDELPENTIPYIAAALERWHGGQFYSEFTEV
ncbi:MAG: NUDIX domain-containing protein [Candidatus Andersenbacteria bacterium]|nr:NUDIX domain-containing protein [Candidatus Andersenbacteria bacterium]